MIVEPPAVYVSKVVDTKEEYRRARPVASSTAYFRIDFGCRLSGDDEGDREMDGHDGLVAEMRRTEPVIDLEEALKRIGADA